MNRKHKRKALQRIAIDLLEFAFNDFIDCAATTHKQALLQKYQAIIKEYGITEQHILKAAKQLLHRIGT